MTGSRWTAQPERGTSLWLRIMVWITLRLSGRAGRMLLFPITAWFWASSPRERRASREFLARALGRPATQLQVARHIYTFASAILDRLFIVAGRSAHLRIETTGLEHLTATLARGQGCVLLGAHLGSFEVLRAIASQAPVPVKTLMFQRNAGRYTGVLEQLNPRLQDSVIEIGTASSMLQVRECLQRGEIVGILADRAPQQQKSMRVPFLGSPAPFPTGPLILSSVLGVPALVFYGIRTGPGRYLVQVEPFADRIELRRASRDADLCCWIGRYAESLERTCRAHPYNWFNFYPFWEDPAHVESPSPPRPVVMPTRARDDGALVRGGRGDAATR